MDEIHALGAGVSSAAGGAVAIEGGNWRLFEAFARDAGAVLRLGTVVEDIELLSDGASFGVTTNSSKKADEFDQVLFAAPWGHSPVSKKLAEQFDERIPPQGYVTLHVTLLTTHAPHAVPEFFGLDKDTPMPQTILTTAWTARNRPSTQPPPFQSITFHTDEALDGEWVVKIFSLRPMDDATLRALFGADPTWVLRKTWHSYPKLAPIAAYAPVEPLPGFHYLAALEPWVST